MSKDSFKFKQFTICQDRCAMKVGTDGTLLGAWAMNLKEKGSILDIGTGTGLIALMMAQRFPKAHIVGIDIDPKAVGQAKENVSVSPFSERIDIVQTDIRDYVSEPFDTIVCNPPFFIDSLKCPDKQRNLARHTQSMSYVTLMKSAYRLLDADGIFSLIIPSDYRSRLEEEAALAGFVPSRICSVKTTPSKAPKRQLMEFKKTSVLQVNIEIGVLENSANKRSEWYQNLVKDFYLSK